jgi:hypothetical protein
MGDSPDGESRDLAAANLDRFRRGLVTVVVRRIVGAREEERQERSDR